MPEQNLTLSERANALKKRGEEIAKLPVMSRVAAAQSMGEDVAALLVDMAETLDRIGRAMAKTCNYMDHGTQIFMLQEKRIANLEALVSGSDEGEAGE